MFKTFAMLDCTQLHSAGGSVLRQDVRIACESPEYHQAYVVALLSIGIYCIGLPILAVAVLRFHRDALFLRALTLD